MPYEVLPLRALWKHRDLSEGRRVPVVCCGEEMQELRPGTVDASVEKHVPLVEKDGSRVTVSVGAAEHPMIPEHFIQWILLETSEGIQRNRWPPGREPRAVFQLSEA